MNSNEQGSDATERHLGTDSNTGNCTTIPHSAVPGVTSLVDAFGRALDVTERKPETCSGVLAESDKMLLASIRRNRMRGYLPTLREIDDLLAMISRLGA